MDKGSGVLFEHGEIPVEGPDVFGAMRFKVGAYPFVFESGTVYGQVAISMLPLAFVPNYQAAIYYALGFVDGTEIDLLKLGCRREER